MFNSDLALSVAMTAISTILSVVALPVNLIIYANFAYDADITEQIDWASVFAALAVVISAIVLGIFASFQAASLQFNVIANRVSEIVCYDGYEMQYLRDDAKESSHFNTDWKHCRLFLDTVFGNRHKYWRGRFKDMVKALDVLRCLCCPMRNGSPLDYGSCVFVETRTT